MTVKDMSCSTACPCSCGGGGFTQEGTHTLLSVRDRLSASLDRLCCSLSLALVAGAKA